MKKLYCFIIVIGLQFNLFSQAGWYQQTSGTTENLNSVCFVDQNTGWTVGSNGTILSTINAGENWVSQESGTNVRLNSVDFINASIGWTGGGSGTILKTTNGGTNWIQQTTGTSEDISSVCFVDQDNGWIAGGRNILNTTDGGINWGVQFSVDTTYEPFHLREVCFVDQNNGWVVGNGFDSLLDYRTIIMNTSDGGINWVSQSLQSLPINSIYFVNENYGWISGYGIFKTTDGGENWQQIAVPNAVSRSIVFIDELTGWSVGFEMGDAWEHIECSTDGGEHWTSQLFYIGSSLNSIYFVDHNNGWVVGGNGTIFHTATGGTIPVELTSFTASTSQGKVTLSWATSTETNNLGFEIERKQDSNDWERVGFVAGHGTTTEHREYSYANDVSNINSNSIAYRLKQIDFDGSFEYSDVVYVDNILLTDFSLHQNFPNPFNPTTIIKYSLPVKAQVELVVYNSLGEIILQIVNEIQEAGNYEIEFNAEGLPSGVYLYRLQAVSFIKTRKMVLLK